MRVKELSEKLNYEIVTAGDMHKEITGCYIGDLLSWVMGHASPGNLWITIMSNINVIAVAVLTEVSCILLAENVPLDDLALKKAIDQGVCILRTKESAYEAAVKINNCLTSKI